MVVSRALCCAPSKQANRYYRARSQALAAEPACPNCSKPTCAPFRSVLVHVAGVAGFVLPGDRVDVLLTRTPKLDGEVGELDPVTDMLLQNVRVIAVDQRASEKNNETKVSKTATLSVDQQSAQKLVLAGQVGSLSLALRNGANMDEFASYTVGTRDLGPGNTGPSLYAGAGRRAVRHLPLPPIRSRSRWFRAPPGHAPPWLQPARRVRPIRLRSKSSAARPVHHMMLSATGGIERMKSKTIMTIAALGLCATLSVAMAPAALAQGYSTSSDAGLLAGQLDVPLNKSQVVTVDRPFGKAMVGNQEIADIVPITNRSLYVLGKKMGTTSLTIYDNNNIVISVVDVAVGPDIVSLRRQMAELIPSEQIGARISNDAVVLTGIVSNGPAVDRAMELAKSYAGDKVINMMSIGASQQVMLEVRFSEINRQTGKQIGFSGFTGSEGGTFGSATGNGAGLVPERQYRRRHIAAEFDHEQLWRVPQGVRRVGT